MRVGAEESAQSSLTGSPGGYVDTPIANRFGPLYADEAQPETRDDDIYVQATIHSNPFSEDNATVLDGGLSI